MAGGNLRPTRDAQVLLQRSKYRVMPVIISAYLDSNSVDSTLEHLNISFYIGFASRNPDFNQHSSFSVIEY